MKIKVESSVLSSIEQARLSSAKAWVEELSALGVDPSCALQSWNQTAKERFVRHENRIERNCQRHVQSILDILIGGPRSLTEISLGLQGHVSSRIITGILDELESGGVIKRHQEKNGSRGKTIVTLVAKDD